MAEHLAGFILRNNFLITFAQMKLTKSIWLGLMLIALSGSSCGTLSRQYQALQKVERGMSSLQVGQLLGQPQYRRFNEVQEEWEYHDHQIAGVHVAIITFERGKVIKLDTFFAKHQPTPPTDPIDPETNRPPIGYPPVVPPPYPDGSSRVPNIRRPESEQWFEDLYQRVRRELFKEDRLRLIEEQAQFTDFSVEQTRRLMALYRFDDDRLDILRILASRIWDLEYADRLIDMFSYDSAKQRAHQYLQAAMKNRSRHSYPPPPPHPRALVDEVWFQGFLSRVKGQVFSDDKNRLILVAAETRFFNVSQARRLMELYTFDDDRLRVLRIIARRIVGLENADRIIELFTFDRGREAARDLLRP